MRGIAEGIYRAVARSYWVSPECVGRFGCAARARRPARPRLSARALRRGLARRRAAGRRAGEDAVVRHRGRRQALGRGRRGLRRRAPAGVRRGPDALQQRRGPHVPARARVLSARISRELSEPRDLVAGLVQRRRGLVGHPLGRFGLGVASASARCAARRGLPRLLGILAGAGRHALVDAQRAARLAQLGLDRLAPRRALSSLAPRARRPRAPPSPLRPARRGRSSRVCRSPGMRRGRRPGRRCRPRRWRTATRRPPRPR